jgi:Flp pilus assembly pilin Flp
MSERVEVPEVTSRSIALCGESPRREDGQALVEYTLILALVTVVSIAALSALGDSVIALLQAVTSALNTVI